MLKKIEGTIIKRTLTLRVIRGFHGAEIEDVVKTILLLIPMCT
jgi:hypothetical protein